MLYVLLSHVLTCYCLPFLVLLALCLFWSGPVAHDEISDDYMVDLPDMLDGGDPPQVGTLNETIDLNPQDPQPIARRWLRTCTCCYRRARLERT